MRRADALARRFCIPRCCTSRLRQMAAKPRSSAMRRIRLLGWPRLPNLSPERRKLDHVHDAGNALAVRSSEEGIASDPVFDLQLPLAATAALYRPDRRAGRLCGAVPEGVMAPVRALV